MLGVLVASLRRTNPAARGRQLVTLQDAGNYITKLPKAEHTAPEWQDAMQALMLVARDGPTMFARIGVMRALNRHVERVFNPGRKEQGFERVAKYRGERALFLLLAAGTNGDTRAGGKTQ